MKTHRVSDSFTELEKRQMETIDKLQEKIKLIEFDRVKDNEKIAILKRKLNCRNEAIKNAIRNIKKYNINFAVMILQKVITEEENNDKNEI